MAACLLPSMHAKVGASAKYNILLVSEAATFGSGSARPPRSALVELMVPQRTDAWRAMRVRRQPANDVNRFGESARHSVVLRELSTASPQPKRKRIAFL